MVGNFPRRGKKRRGKELRGEFEKEGEKRGGWGSKKGEFREREGGGGAVEEVNDQVGKVILTASGKRRK